MSLSLSATGWSAGGTVLTLTAGSAAGVVEAAAGAGAAGATVAVAGAVRAGGVAAVSVEAGSGTLGASVAFSGVTGAGAVATSAGLVLVGFAASAVAGVVEPVASILKSAAVGGGTLAGSGRGIAASIASSAGRRARGILRQCRGCGHREESRRDGHQDAVKSTTIVQTVSHRHTPRVITAPARNSLGYRCQLRQKGRPADFCYVCTPRFITNDTQALLVQPAPPGALTTN